MKNEFKTLPSSCDDKVDLTEEYGFKCVELVYGVGEKKESIFINTNEIEFMSIDSIDYSKHLIADGVLFPFIRCEGFKILIKKEIIDSKLYEQLVSLRNINLVLVHYNDNSLDVYGLPTEWYATDINGKYYEFNTWQEISEEYNENKDSNYIRIEVKNGGKYYDSN